jgi:Tfp pilus assembly protein PilV
MIKLSKKVRSCDGVSILEVLVAMIITSVALLLLLNLAMIALDGNDWSNNTTRITQLLQEKLEQARTINPAPGTYTDTAGDYVRTCTVDSVDLFLKEVVVEIAWTDIRGHDKSYSMSALMKTP